MCIYRIYIHMWIQKTEKDKKYRDTQTEQTELNEME